MPVTSQAEMTPSLKHFLTCARRGGARGASTGEKRCRRIAEALLENVGCLDGRALAGAEQFVRVAVHQPETARKVLDLD